jgi:hypothetical protein
MKGVWNPYFLFPLIQLKNLDKLSMAQINTSCSNIKTIYMTYTVGYNNYNLDLSPSCTERIMCHLLTLVT